MSTPAICIVCGDENDYPARRGDRLKDRSCRHCGSQKALQRAGRNPSAAARVKRATLGRCPQCGTASIAETDQYTLDTCCRAARDQVANYITGRS